ncbi:hypothetical protein L1887_50158 [Cichorium endivia]|nr:hypothetical protein L1887_50158 [Cichorium endivia]
MKKVFHVRRTCAARASAVGRGSTGSSRGADRRVELKGTCDMCSAEEHVNVWKAPSQRLSAAERDVNERGSQKRTRGGMTRSPWYKGRLDTLDVSPNQLGFQEADRTPYKEGGDRRAVREPVFCHSPYRVQRSRQTTAAGEEAERRLRNEARTGQGRPRRNGQTTDNGASESSSRLDQGDAAGAKG